MIIIMAKKRRTSRGSRDVRVSVIGAMTQVYHLARALGVADGARGGRTAARQCMSDALIESWKYYTPVQRSNKAENKDF
jgi:hypothetical protein